MAKILFVIFEILTIFSFTNASDKPIGKMINCFFGSWSKENLPEIVDSTSCTHLSYAFFELTENGRIEAELTMEDIDLIANVRDFNDPELRLPVIAIITDSSKDFTSFYDIAIDDEKRRNFIDSVQMLLRQYFLNGVDLYWPNPGHSGSIDERFYFVVLLKELYQELKMLNYTTGVSVSGNIEIAQKWYDIPNIIENVDYVNIMAYNYTNANAYIFHAPLYGPPFYEDDRGDNNVHGSIRHWLIKGAPPSKLNMGVAFIGRSYRIRRKDPSVVIVDNEAQRTGSARSSRVKAYHEICSKDENITEVSHYISSMETGFRIRGSILTTFESPESLEAKMIYMNSIGLGGVMIWTIDNDDLIGVCDDSFPLMEVIKKFIYRCPKIAVSNDLNKMRTNECGIYKMEL
ncbi:chitotriosidase-1-like [Haematobia irritans]|uniref:chitotriosidase-1-like n=1 Tax=Haematobia irritans TaxID=7368 RepID=UPI003F4F7464